MFRCFLAVLLISLGLVSASMKITIKMNASHYYEGTAAKLVCIFPSSIKGSYIWSSMNNALSTGLKCRPNLQCNNVSGYEISRIEQNLTLIINSVDIAAPTWQCTDHSGTYVETITLNITKNPPLHIKFMESNSVFKIKTSCSAVAMNVSCHITGKLQKIGLKDLESSPCSSNELFSMVGTLKDVSGSEDITCSVTRLHEHYSAYYKAPQKILYYIGGALIVIGLIIIIGAIIKRFEHVCVFGVVLVLIGIALIVYNHYFKVFVAFLVLGVLTAAVNIAHLLYKNKDKLYIPANTS